MSPSDISYQLAQGLSLILQTIAILGALFGLLGWLRADIRAELRYVEGRVNKGMDQLSESADVTSARLADALSTLSRMEAQLENLENQAQRWHVERSERRRIQS